MHTSVLIQYANNTTMHFHFQTKNVFRVHSFLKIIIAAMFLFLFTSHNKTKINQSDMINKIQIKKKM